MVSWRNDDIRLSLAFVMLILIIGTFLALFYKDFQDQQYRALVFLIMITLTLPIWLTDQALDIITKHKFLDAAGLGANINTFALSLGAGVFLGLLLTLSRMSVTPEAVIVGATPLFNFFYTVIAAPVVEELFFRAVLFFMLVKLFDVVLTSSIRAEQPRVWAARIAGAVVASLFFVLYHFFLPTTSALTVETRAMGNLIFSLIAITLTLATKSLGGALGAHITTNLVNLVNWAG